MDEEIEKMLCYSVIEAELIEKNFQDVLESNIPDTSVNMSVNDPINTIDKRKASSRTSSPVKIMTRSKNPKLEGEERA